MTFIMLGSGTVAVNGGGGARNSRYLLLGKAKAGWGDLGVWATLDKLAAGAGHDEGRPVPPDPDRRAIGPRLSG